MAAEQVVFPAIAAEWAVDSDDFAAPLWGLLQALANQQQPDSVRAGEPLRVVCEAFRDRQGWLWRYTVVGATSGAEYGLLVTVPGESRLLPIDCRERLGATLEGLLNGTAAASVRAHSDLQTLLAAQGGRGWHAGSRPQRIGDGWQILEGERGQRLIGLAGLLGLFGFSILLSALLQAAGSH